MVGNPWQSKACVTCRKRKVKCDLQEPECGNCLKRGIKCQGYLKDRIFIHQTAQSMTIAKSRGGLNRHSVTQLQFCLRAQPISLSPVNAVVDSGPMKREQLFSSYFTVYFPPDIRGSTDIDPWYTMISGIMALPNKTVMLESALSAQACILLGKQNRDDFLFYHGLRLYNSAIRYMSHMISRKHYYDDLVYTAAIFQALEEIYCPHGIHVWVAHITGMNELLDQCYTQAHGSPLMKMIYQRFHKFKIIWATTGINLTADEYSYFMQSSNDEPTDELLKLIADFSIIFKNLDEIDESDPNACQSLLSQCLSHEANVMAWYAWRKNTIGGSPRTCSPDEIQSSGLSMDPIFGTPYSFSSLDNARLHVLFWIAMSMTQRLISKARSYTYQFSAEDGSGNKEYLLAEFFADEISRAIPYCFKDCTNLWNTHIVSMGVGQICKVYTDHQNYRKFLWGQQAYGIIANLGHELATRLSEVFWQRWNAAEEAAASSGANPINYLSLRPGFPHEKSLSRKMPLRFKWPEQ